MNIYEPPMYAMSAREETRLAKAEALEEHLTERGLLVMQDWTLLKEYDTRYHFMGLPSEVIIAWHEMGQPILYNHPEINPHIINQAVAGAINGEEETLYTFMLCAAICEETDSNRSPDVKPSEAYDRLFNEVKCVVEKEQEMDRES